MTMQTIEKARNRMYTDKGWREVEILIKGLGDGLRGNLGNEIADDDSDEAVDIENLDCVDGVLVENREGA